MSDDNYENLTTNQKINFIDRTAQEQRVPTKSSELLETIYNLSPSVLGQVARDVTEIQNPETQGKNAYALAEYIIQKGPTFRPEKPEIYKRAIFFKNLYDSNVCYLCGYPIDTTISHAEELEHVLPIAEALALTAIIQLKGKEFKRNLEEISNSKDAYLYLLEYARAHTCCNQAKGVVSFLSFNGTPPYKEPYKIDNNSISQVFKNIWKNFGHGGNFQQFPHACANTTLVTNYFSKVSMDKFIQERKQYLINNFMTPILNEIKTFVGTNGLQFAQLCYLANQALSIDQKVWGYLGSKWQGDEIDLPSLKRLIIEGVITNPTKPNSSYNNTIDTVINEILKIYDRNTNIKLNSIINQHFNQYLRDENQREQRKINKQTFSRIINIEYNSFFDIHIEYLTARNSQELLNYQQYRYIFFGIEYIFYLLESQKSDFKFNTAMVEQLVEMVYNVNKYTIYYIFLYFIIYNPFYNTSNFESKDNANTTELDNFIQTIYTPYEEIQLNFVNSVFENFNFLSNISSIFKLDLQVLTNYGSYIATSPITIITAKTLLQLSRSGENQLDREFSTIKNENKVNPTGGKKTKKHNKTKTKKQNRTKKQNKHKLR